MPLIDVTYDGKVDEEILRRLGELLPDVVGEAVECPEEPSTGPPEPGDIEIRFRRKSPLDVGERVTATLDRRDFSIVRPRHVRAFHLVPP